MAKRGKVDAWMPLWIGDFTADTAELDNTEVGSYMLLMMWQWRRGPIPDNDKRLAQIARCSEHSWSSLRAVLAPFFTVADGTWIHQRVAEERRKAEHNARVNERRAAAAAEARWGPLRNRTGDASSNPPGNAPSMPEAMPEQCPSPSPSTSPSIEGEGPRKRGTRLPEKWLPQDATVEEIRAECPGVNLRAETRKFRDYWKAKTGKDATKLDWDATWRNWIRRAAETMKDPHHEASPRMSASEAVAAANRRAEAGSLLSAEYFDHEAPLAGDE